MKKIITFFKATTLLLLLVNASEVIAQISCSLKMAPSSRTFEYLTSGTNVPDIETDEGTKTGIPIGFTFKTGTCANPKSYTTVQVSSNGWLKFTGSATVGAVPKAAPAASGAPSTVWPAYAPFWGDLSGDAGTATYLTELLPSGLKVFTMEWKNYKFDKTATSPVLSFQIKLYEGSNIFEYCYKKESGTPVIGGSIKGMIAVIDKLPPPLSIAACYDYFIFSDVSASPVLNRTGSYGQNLDDVPASNQVYQFYNTCCGKPQAGIIDQPDSVCQASPFVAKLSGATPSPFAVYGVSYLWQSAPAATGPWTDVGVKGTATTKSFAGVFGVDTFLRVVVFCDSSGLTDTTPIKQIKLISLPYNCYCYSASTADVNNNGVNIGNMKLITAGKDTLINNGNATPAFLNKTFFRNYTLFTGLRPIKSINRDTSYKLVVSGITKDSFAFAASGVALYIDYNNDGVYSAATELASFQVISGTSSSFTTNFTVPSFAVLDTVGMRLIMKKGATTSADVPPCGGYAEGETEDYLISINNPNCPGPISAGTTYIADTSMCYGYQTTVYNSTHGRNLSLFDWDWEYSLDNVIWATVAGGKFMDTIQPVVRQSTYYRLRTVCYLSNDTIYSNKVFIKLKQPYKCYCFSIANVGGMAMDSSDISTFTIDKFVSNSGGPHLNNPRATRMRTDFTDLPAIELWAETSYPIAVYHTLRTKIHADARITVFMDLNHNLKYDGASEIIWSTTTSASNFYPHATITIPRYVVPDVETGMRVVLTNNMGVNNPSDLGCDAFESGEIEDYLVILRRYPTSIDKFANIDNLQIYPNPNNGQFVVSFKAQKAISEASVTVTNITGQKVYSENYTNVSNTFMKNINLGVQASGVYFITVVADGQKIVNKLIVQ